MTEWAQENLGELARVRRGLSYSDATIEDDPDCGKPYINMKSFLKDGGYNKQGLKYFSGPYSEGDIATGEHLLLANTDVTLSGDIIGVPAYLPDELRRDGVLFSHHVTRLELQPRVRPKFLYYLLCMNQYRRWMLKYSRGTTVLMTDMSAIKRIPIAYPKDRLSQDAIAKVLGSVDAAIDATEALIEKYQQIKAGLMHDLFTRGVLPNGQLRPTREQAPELYQETAIGWIPMEWKLDRCENLCTRICVGIVIQPASYYVVSGVPALRSANVREGEIDLSNLAYISPASNALLVKSQIRVGDILSVRTGYPGTSAVVPAELDGSNCVDILISSPGIGIDAGYLCSWINSSFGKEQVLRRQGGLAQQHFNVGEMRNLLVAIPSKDEQHRIHERLSALDSKLSSESDHVQKLRLQKLGLMQDLLTGKVQVKVDNNVVERAND